VTSRTPHKESSNTVPGEATLKQCHSVVPAVLQEILNCMQKPRNQAFSVKTRRFEMICRREQSGTEVLDRDSTEEALPQPTSLRDISRNPVRVLVKTPNCRARRDARDNSPVARLGMKGLSKFLSYFSPQFQARGVVKGVHQYARLLGLLAHQA
jgi:hypothetical protein